MIKIVRQPRPEEDSSFPWMRLGKAVMWALYRTEQKISFEGGDPSEADWHTSLSAIRSVLASGALVAWGQREWNASHEEIPAIDWTSRPVSYHDHKLVYRPFEVIRVRRDDVFRIWPPLAAEKKPGRPSEFDWDAIRSMAQNEPRHLSQNQVTEVLLALCSEGGKRPPGKSRLKEKLREWGWPEMGGN